MRMTVFLSPSTVKAPLEGKTREEVIVELIGLLPLPDDVCREEVFQSVMEREKLMTTGIGRGIAIPHGVTPISGDLMAAMGIPKQPIDFQSIDKRPVEIIFLLAACPNCPTEHIKAMARISRLLHREDFHESLTRCTSSEGVWSAIEKEEARHKI
jgi:mannitol/fructose-specific phosphotransferase system IIA component (Ntr-type)